MARTPIRDFLDGYENTSHDDSSSVLGRRFFCRSLSGTVTPAMIGATKRGILRLLTVLNKKIQYASAKSYGAMSLAFGLITIILSFLADYGSATGQAATVSFIIGVCFALLSIPLLLVDGPVALIFQNSRFLDKILFEFLCINRVQRNEAVKPMPIAVNAIFGALLGFIGYFIPAWWVIVGYFALLFIYLSMGSPEFALFTMIFALPYASVDPRALTALSAVSILAIISFLRKVLSGKRVFSFEQYDLLVLLTVLSILISGVFVKGVDVFLASGVSCVLTLVYFLSSNLITNRRLADCMLFSTVLSVLPATVHAYVIAVSAAVADGPVAILRGGVGSVFGRSDTFAAFLLIAIVLDIALIKQTRGIARAAMVTLAVLYLGALVITGEYAAVLALVLGIVVYLALQLRNIWSCVVTVAAFLLPYIAIAALYFIIPTNTSLMPDGKSAAELVSGVANAAREIMAHPVLGEGAQSVTTGSLNIFIDIAAGTGIPTLLFFALMLGVRQRHRTLYHFYIKNSEISILSPAVAAAALGFLCFASVSAIWNSPAAYCIFWAVFGLGSATLRVAKKEHDDRVLYFEDTIDSESSVVDVNIV